MTDPDIDLDLSTEQLAAIGLLSARWSFFETEMDFTISALGHLVEKDRRMDLGFSRRVDRWRKLVAKYYSGPTLAEVRGIITEANKIHNARCIVLHGRVYGFRPPRKDEILVEQIEHKKEWRAQTIRLNLSGLGKAERETASLTMRLIKFNALHLPVSPRAWPRTRP